MSAQQYIAQAIFAAKDQAVESLRPKGSKVRWYIVQVAAIVAFLILLCCFLPRITAIQQAAFAAIAAAVVVIPYCSARAMDEIRLRSR